MARGARLRSLFSGERRGTRLCRAVSGPRAAAPLGAEPATPAAPKGFSPGFSRKRQTESVGCSLPVPCFLRKVGPEHHGRPLRARGSFRDPGVETWLPFPVTAGLARPGTRRNCLAPLIGLLLGARRSPRPLSKTRTWF